MCEDETLTLTAEILNISDFPDPQALQYNWYKDGQDLNLHTQQIEVTEPGTYRVEVSYGGCAGADEIEVAYFANSKCIIPNVITPNEDGKNDALVLDFLNAKEGIDKIEIFNRWGHVVFEKENGYTDEWHGQSPDGKDLPNATYYYVIKLRNGETKTGWVYLIK